MVKKNKKTMLTSKRGFTLIELLVVIAIIGLLSTLAVVALGSARAKGRDARRIADVKQYQTALELFYADYGYYPGQGETTPVVLGDASDATCLDNAGFQIDCSDGSQIYVKNIQTAPTPPQNNQYTYQPATCDGGTPNKCNDYTVTFQLETPNQGLPASTSICATPEGIKQCPTPPPEG